MEETLWDIVSPYLNSQRYLLFYCLNSLNVIHYLHAPNPQALQEFIERAQNFEAFLKHEYVHQQNSGNVEWDLCLYATGLVAYGHKELLDVAVHTLPVDRDPNYHMGRCVAAPSMVLSCLLPIPKDLRPKAARKPFDKPKLIAWYEAHKDRLEWDSEEERYLLRP